MSFGIFDRIIGILEERLDTRLTEEELEGWKVLLEKDLKELIDFSHINEDRIYGFSNISFHILNGSTDIPEFDLEEEMKYFYPEKATGYDNAIRYFDKLYNNFLLNKSEGISLSLYNERDIDKFEREFNKLKPISKIRTNLFFFIRTLVLNAIYDNMSELFEVEGKTLSYHAKKKVCENIVAEDLKSLLFFETSSLFINAITAKSLTSDYDKVFYPIVPESTTKVRRISEFYIFFAIFNRAMTYYRKDIQKMLTRLMGIIYKGRFFFDRTEPSSIVELAIVYTKLLRLWQISSAEMCEYLSTKNNSWYLNEIDTDFGNIEKSRGYILSTGVDGSYALFRDKLTNTITLSPIDTNPHTWVVVNKNTDYKKTYEYIRNALETVESNGEKIDSSSSYAVDRLFTATVDFLSPYVMNSDYPFFDVKWLFRLEKDPRNEKRKCYRYNFHRLYRRAFGKKHMFQRIMMLKERVNGDVITY